MRKLALLLLFATAALGQPTNININKIGNTQVPTGLVAADGILVKCPACPTGSGGGTTGTPADAFANPGAISEFLGFPLMWNGSSWDKVRGDTTLGLWVNLKNSSIAVTGTFWQGTQPVSIAGTVTTSVSNFPATQAVSWASAQHVIVDTAPTTAVTVASLPLPSNAAQETSGNLATIATNTTGSSTAANQTSEILNLAAIIAKLPTLLNNSQQVVVNNAPPLLTSAQLNNPLLMRAAMAQFCRTNLCVR